jgi:DNA primase
MGTAATEEQVGELARLAPTVLLALDADAAGQEAMLRAARVAARRKLVLRVVELPGGSDPADLVAAEGARAMAERVDASVPFVRFRVERELGAGNLSSAEGKDAAIAALRPVFAQIPPSAMREELVGLVADRTGLAPTLVASWLAQGSRSAGAPAGGNGPARPPAPPQAALDALGRAERSFLAQCLAAPTGGRSALADLDLEAWFSSELTRRAAAWLRGELASGTSEYPEDDELGRLIAALRVQSGDMRDSEAALEGEGGRNRGRQPPEGSPPRAPSPSRRGNRTPPRRDARRGRLTPHANVHHVGIGVLRHGRSRARVSVPRR